MTRFALTFALLASLPAAGLRAQQKEGDTRRAAFAMCSARSPIRSRSSAMWITDTTVRRSPATGAWRANNTKAASSARALLAMICS